MLKKICKVAKLCIIILVAISILLGITYFILKQSGWTSKLRDWESHSGAELRYSGETTDLESHLCDQKLTLPHMRFQLETTINEGSVTYSLRNDSEEELDTITITETSTTYMDLSNIDCDHVVLYSIPTPGTKAGVSVWTQYRITNEEYYYYRLPFTWFPLDSKHKI